MKFNLIALSLLAVSSFANAQSLTPNPGVPGGVSATSVRCVPTNHMVGVDYGITIFTQALAPEYNVRGGIFSKIGVYPGAVAQNTTMYLSSQTAKVATFKVESSDLIVVLDKTNYTADVYREGRSLPYYVCGK
ncbi:hypothetical protein [Silvanigrella sp.]|jgi:hypothetical protein|uniref:hypothetical protein n=1 Tax=Silvanigrella sp. TaxID=2024976 RepID=UPI0037CC54AB